MTTLATRVGHRRQRGQALMVGALMMFLLIGMSALAVDMGMNYVDRRALQTASDQGALAAAGELNSSATAALTAGQVYAWANLHVSPGSTSCSASPCTVTNGNYPNPGSYSVTVTTPYTPSNSSEYSANRVVSVDIVHVNPRSSFASVLGLGAVTVRSHSAALSHVGSAKFPFAIATRLLDITGSAGAVSYGSVLIDDCDDGGKGDFTDHSVGGGLYINGSGSLTVGRSTDSSNLYTSAQAVLLADGRNHTCNGSANSNPDTSWSTLGDKVQFSSGYAEYNYDYGFTSGPTGCSTAATSSANPSYCMANADGDGTWEDPPCWKQSNGSIIPVASTTTVYTDGSTVPNPPAPSIASCTTSATHSYEGSYTYSNFPNFPSYADPISILSGLGVSVANTGTGVLTAGTVSPNQYFIANSAAVSASLLFKPGYYVFSGAAASVLLKNGSSFSCMNPSKVSPAPAVQGCVFIFSNGAALDIQSSSAQVNCSANSGGGDYGNCAFEFTDTNSSLSYLSFSNGVSVAAHPIVYSSGSSTNLHMPLVYANSSSNCLSSGVVSCAVSLTQGSSTVFDITGTIYVPHGITNISANGSAASGQIISDAVRLQSGNSGAMLGVAYRGDAVAPVPGGATLIE